LGKKLSYLFLFFFTCFENLVKGKYFSGFGEYKHKTYKGVAERNKFAKQI